MRKNILAAAISAATLAAMQPLWAQDADDDTAGEQIVEELMVTGSRLVSTNAVSASPVTAVDASDFRATGNVRVEDLINDLPQVKPTQTAGQANGATGTATVDLRGLGAVRTLVLMNGRRLPPGSPLAGGSSSDLNQIPGLLIERTEILTGGASSTYGSDAVAGVVNFIMIDDFEGFQIDVQHSRYQHDNSRSWMQRLITENGFPVEDGNVWDGDADDVSLVWGANFADNEGNVTAYASWRKIDSVLQGDRDYSGCALGGEPGAWRCGGSSTIPTGRFTDFGTNDLGPFDFTIDQTDPNGAFVDRDGLVYNYGPLNYFQRPDERFMLGAFANYEINEYFNLYGEVNFMDDRSVAQIAPSGAFFVTDSLNCDNPLLSDEQAALICGPDAGAPVDTSVFIGRRNVEGGPRQNDLRHTSFRYVFGMNGSIDEVWSYDIYGLHSEVALAETYLNDLSTSRISRALDVVTDPETGDPVCRSALDGTDPACVPWNIFRPNGIVDDVNDGVTQEALDYLVLPLFARGTTELDVISGYVKGDLGPCGWILPCADEPVSVLIGYEHRREAIDYDPDNGYITGDGAGQGGPTDPVEGSVSVDEIFMEANVPIWEGQSWADYFGLELGYRYSDYDNGVDANTWKVGMKWNWFEGLGFRASFNRAIRAPNVRELFAPQSVGLYDMTEDPCSPTAEDPATNAECVNTGTTLGTPPDNPAGQYNALFGGNLELQEEEGETWSVGMIWEPTFWAWLEGSTISVDYFDIEVEDAIAPLDPTNTFMNCLTTGDPTFCDLVQRDPAAESLWLTGAQVIATNQNIGLLSTEGVDLTVDYSFEIGEWGGVDLLYVGTFVTEYDIQNDPTAAIDECEGYWGGICGAPSPEYSHFARASWSSPWCVDFSLGWRHIGSVDQYDTENGADFDHQDYLDLSASFDLFETGHTIRAGVNNVLDRDPPLSGDAGAGIFGNGNTFPGVYDALGRYFFVGATFTF